MVQLLRFLSGIRVVRFFIAGGWNVIFSYGVFAGLYYVLGDQVHYMLILTGTTILGVTNSYLTQKFFVFRTKGNYLREYLRFYAVYGIQITINYVMLPFLVEWGVSPYIAQALIVGSTTIGTYWAHKHISFSAGRVDPLSNAN